MNPIFLTVLLSLLASGCASSSEIGPSSAPAMFYDDTQPAATVGPFTISHKDLNEAAAKDLKPIESDIYRIKSKRLDLLIRAQLWRLAAQDRGVSVAELQQKVAGDPEAFLGKLGKEYDVHVFLKPPRFSVPAGSSPVRGNEKAPVTIVEFTDFECPFCRRFQPTFHQILDQYQDQVKFVFKHAPLPFHLKARKAHMASLCADAQGKFWEYRDLLFEQPGGLEQKNLVSYGEKLGLSMDAFTVCLDSDAYAEKIDQDLAEGHELGVQGTPTFFVNGRMLSGAQPFFRFAQMIDEELEIKK